MKSIQTFNAKALAYPKDFNTPSVPHSETTARAGNVTYV
jgi:hypothetical protein